MLKSLGVTHHGCACLGSTNFGGVFCASNGCRDERHAARSSGATVMAQNDAKADGPIRPSPVCSSTKWASRIGEGRGAVLLMSFETSATRSAFVPATSWVETRGGPLYSHAVIEHASNIPITLPRRFWEILGSGVSRRWWSWIVLMVICLNSL